MPRLIAPKPEPTPKSASTFHKIDTDLCDLTEVDGDNLSSYTSNGWKVAAVMQGHKAIATPRGNTRVVPTTIYLVGRNLEAALEDRMKYDAEMQKKVKELEGQLCETRQELRAVDTKLVEARENCRATTRRLKLIKNHRDALETVNRRYEETIGRLRVEFGDAAIRKALGEE